MAFFGGGAPSAKFKAVGDKIEGEILDVRDEVQQRAFKPNGIGDLLFWDDGKPRMQLPIEVQTDQRDPSIEDDDGVRAIYVKGQMKKAIGEALKKAGHRGDPEVGAQLIVQFYDEEENGTANPTKLYRAKYTKPAKQVEEDPFS